MSTAVPSAPVLVYEQPLGIVAFDKMSAQLQGIKNIHVCAHLHIHHRIVRASAAALGCEKDPKYTPPSVKAVSAQATHLPMIEHT